MSRAKFRLLLAFAVPMAIVVAFAPAFAQPALSGPDYFSPGSVVGDNKLHIVANEYYLGKTHQMIYTSAGISGVLSKAEVIGQRVSGPALVYDTDGLHVFVVDSTGRLSHRQRSSAGVWSAWSVVPKGSGLHGRPTAAIYQGTTYVFVIGGDGNIWYTTGSKGGYGSTWTRMADFKSLQSPSAMADGKRLMVVGISPSTSMGLYKQFSNGQWGQLRGLLTDPANAPKGQLVVAAGDRDDSVWLASALYLPANKIMVSDALATANRYDGEQLDGTVMTPPILTRHVNGAIGMIVRSSSDKLLWYRQLANGTWTGWSKLDPPR